MCSHSHAIGCLPNLYCMYCGERLGDDWFQGPKPETPYQLPPWAFYLVGVICVVGAGAVSGMAFLVFVETVLK